MSDTQIREVIADKPTFRSLIEGSVFNAHEDWDQGTQSFEVFCGLVADNAENALTALTDADVDAAITDFYAAAWEEGRQDAILEWKIQNSNVQPSDRAKYDETLADSNARREDLKAIIAMRGRGVVTKAQVREAILSLYEDGVSTEYVDEYEFLPTYQAYDEPIESPDIAIRIRWKDVADSVEAVLAAKEQG